jgi:hypothetical protein
VGRKDPEYLNVSGSLMVEAINLIKNGIKNKLAAAKKMIDCDKDIAAGIYVYALEELGKLEVLKDASNSRRVEYRDMFLSHREKFFKAHDCVIRFYHPECISIGGSFSESFSDTSFTQFLEAETDARLGIFYIDFEYDKFDTATKVKKIPFVNETKLKNAIDGLEDVMKKWT